jgi:2-polyprenyl-3-methyl-5-hydroxy-6-metoxy-1,4-benzoquinol methylase
MKEINIKTIYFISGEHNNGKSTIASYFNLDVIALDDIFAHFYNKYNHIIHFINIFSCTLIWPSLTEIQKNEFIQLVIIEIEKFIASDFNEIVFEGWLLEFFKEDLKNKYNNIVNICDIYVSDFNCIVDNITFQNEKESEIEKNIVNPIKNYFSDKIINNLDIKYHFFEDFNIGNPFQNSLEKYKLFFLDRSNLILNKNVLDIGCNTGYNCFKMAEKAKSVTGIDIFFNPIRDASLINNFLYKFNNIKFFQCDFFDFKDGNFDVILASSVIHYFVYDQFKFFIKCHQILNKNGYLILEAGISQLPYFSEIIKRADNTTCEYPSEFKLINELCKDFHLIYKSKSINQHGDNTPRFIFQFLKK